MLVLCKITEDFKTPVTRENIDIVDGLIIQNKVTGRFARVKKGHLLYLNKNNEIVDVVDFNKMYENTVPEETPWYSSITND